jgi:D-alanyl-D-alanine carboxypeptidase
MLGALASGVLLVGCSEVSQPPPATDLADTFQRLLDEAAADPAVPGVALSIDSSVLDLDWAGAAGVADPESGTPMTVDTPVRIASNTKTYVAAAVLRLAEEGKLDLDDSIADHIPEEQVALLEGDGYEPRAMTVRHLLTHTSGLFDHSSGPQYEEAILADPQRQWTPAEQLRAAVEWGDPLAGPGEVYSYCDTGYVLLGEIIEGASGKPLAAAVHQLLDFHELGLAATWWEHFESAPPGLPARAHQLFGDLDTFDFNPSFDLYGGGGLVATVGDLARFWRELFGAGVFREPKSLVVMRTTVDGVRALPDADPGSQPPGAYRMGIWELDVAGRQAYRHTGFWGTSATFVPDLGLVVAATVNQHQAKQVLEDLVRKSIEAVAEAADGGPQAGA